MLINAASLAALFQGWNLSFNKGFEGVAPLWPSIAMRTTSTTPQETYAWLAQIPGIREWIGPRVLHALSLQGFPIENRDFESTVRVPRNAVMDDKYGVFAPLMQDMGRAAAQFPDLLIAALLNAGFTTNCYDGQYFFDSDHLVMNEAGQQVSYSNAQAGSGAPWFLLDTTRAIRPLIYQERMPFRFISHTDPSDDHVFLNKEYIYGSDGRCNVGYGLWQLAFGSKGVLNTANYAAARKAMSEVTGENGRKLGVQPTTLVTGYANEEAARKLISNQMAAGGESNAWLSSATLIISPWL